LKIFRAMMSSMTDDMFIAHQNGLICFLLPFSS